MEIKAKLLTLASHVQPYLRGFYLAGGTAIMFRHKHRVSTDLDFFSYSWFNRERRLAMLRRHFSIEDVIFGEDNVDVFIEGIKVSLVYFPYKNIERVKEWEGIRMASDYDIFLNKLYAVTRRTETKDVIDVAFLYKTYRWNVEDVARDFENKFPGHRFALALGAVANFDDYPDLPEWAKKEVLKMVKSWRYGGS